MRPRFKNITFILLSVILYVSLFGCFSPPSTLRAPQGAMEFPLVSDALFAPAEETPSPAQEASPKPREAPAKEPEAAENAASQVSPEAVESTCTLTVRCDTILENMQSLAVEKASLVPADGLIFHMENISFNPGESVFNVLSRELKRAKIHMEFVNSPMYGSAYIEGIHNLYEFDCGELSGWMYRVNGLFPGYGCSKYILSPGDVIEWVYTCDLGRDVGGYREGVAEVGEGMQ